MKLPIDTSETTFMVALPPEPATDFETKQQKATENGEPIWNVQLVVLGEKTAQIIPVKVAGTLSPALRQGAPVKVSGLVASPWTMGERSGVSFRAARIEPMGSARSSS